MTPKVLMIGGTSHVGKTSLAKRVVAEAAGWNHLSTDRLARHPGRPWQVGESKVPPDVADHYLHLSTAELLDSVLAHYRKNVWPIARAIVRSHTNNPFDPCLVLEGSALLPDLVARARLESVAVWLTADDSLIAERISESSGYARRTRFEQRLIDAFLQRSLAFNRFTVQRATALGLVCLDAGSPGIRDRLTALCSGR